VVYLFEFNTLRWLLTVRQNGRAIGALGNMPVKMKPFTSQSGLIYSSLLLAVMGF